MREVERLGAEVEGTIAGDPWYGSSVRTILEGIDATTAASSPGPGAHSIWELVLHMTAWTREVTRRLRGGRADPPAEGDWPEVKATDASSWAAAVVGLQESHRELARTLVELEDDVLSRQVGGAQVDASGRPVTLHRTVVGLLQHDTYHAGQISLSRKLLEAKLGRPA